MGLEYNNHIKEKNATYITCSLDMTLGVETHIIKWLSENTVIHDMYIYIYLFFINVHYDFHYFKQK